MKEQKLIDLQSAFNAGRSTRFDTGVTTYATFEEWFNKYYPQEDVLTFLKNRLVKANRDLLDADIEKNHFMFIGIVGELKDIIEYLEK